jgi:hypothetical protein
MRESERFDSSFHFVIFSFVDIMGAGASRYIGAGSPAGAPTLLTADRASPRDKPRSIPDGG